jgi:arylsulfatase A
VDYLIEFMEETHEGGPFLAYYAALLPHFPWVPTPDSEDQTMPDDERYGDPKFFPDMVARLDMNVGRLLDALDRLGLAENTVVIFLSDNGTDPQLSARMNGVEVQGGKATLTDRATLVPLLIRWPDRIVPGTVDGELVELADFLPTFAEIAGAPMPEQAVHGQSFASRLLRHGQAPKPWVHIQMAEHRYLRTHEWIVTNEGRYQNVQPYPIDATDLQPSDLSEADQEALHGLERELDRLLRATSGRLEGRQ